LLINLEIELLTELIEMTILVNDFIGRHFLWHSLIEVKNVKFIAVCFVALDLDLSWQD
jgi:hypothetical protein